MNLLHDKSMICTSDLSKRLGVLVSVGFLKSCGVSPIVTTWRGAYWRESDFPIICEAVARRLHKLADAAAEMPG